MEVSALTNSIDNEMFFRILASAVSGNVISQIPEETDVKALYNMSYAHKVVGMVWFALKDAHVCTALQKELLSRLSKYAANVGKQLVLQDYYTDIAVKFCREKGIKFALLKGAVLKHFYPEAVMRSSCDIDILADKSRIDEIIDEFCKLGFEYHEEHDSEEAKHAKLKKESVVIELHRSLCFNGAFGGHYDEPFSVFESSDGVEYTMCPEELYVYNLVHASHHFMKGVNTLRAVCDLYLIKDKYRNMDADKLSRLLEVTGMTGFEKAMSNIAGVVFGEIKPEGELCTVLEYILGNPVRADSAIADLQKEKVGGNSGIPKKTAVVLKRVFPSYELICRRYPNAGKSRMMYPFYVVKRIFDAGKQGRVKEQFDAIGRISDKEMDILETVTKYSGLG